MNDENDRFKIESDGEYSFIPEDEEARNTRASVLTDSYAETPTEETNIENQNAEPYSEPSFEQQAAEIDRKKAELEEQDRKLLQALDEVLEKRSRKMQDEVRQRQQQKTNAVKIAKRAVKKGVGFVSLGLILIFLGIVIIVCLFSPSPDYLIPMKLSPICAILIGIEILANQILTRGKFHLNVPSLITSAALVVGCCIMCTSLNKTYNHDKELYNNRSIAAEIYNRSYNDLRNVADIELLTVDVDLNLDSSGKHKGVEALSPSDIVNITVVLGGEPASPKDFTHQCKMIIDSYRLMEINVTDFYFSNESELYSFKLDVKGRYEQDYSEARLEELVNYVYYDKYGFPEDIEDLVEEESKESKSE